MGGVFLIIFIINGSVNFELLQDQQYNYSIFLMLPFVGVICFLTTLMETNRPPFDLSEAESDVVAGYTVEYAGILFGLFYLGEYVSLFTNSFIIVLLFSGGFWGLFHYIHLFAMDCFSLMPDWDSLVDIIPRSGYSDPYSSYYKSRVVLSYEF